MGIRGRQWLAVTCLMLAAAACSGDDDDGHHGIITDPPRSTSTTQRSTTTTETTIDPQADVKAEVEAAYLAYVHAFLDIFAEPNPNNPLIEQHTTGIVREVTLDAISQDILNGTAVRPPEDPADYEATVLSVEVQGDTATIRTCNIDGSRVVKVASGEVLNDTVATLHVEAQLSLDNGAWKVAESRILERTEGRRSCA